MLRIRGSLIMFVAMCTVGYAFPMDSTLIFRPPSVADSNSVWVMNHTLLESPYLDGTPDSYLWQWGGSTDAVLVGDVQGDGFDDAVFVHEGDITGWCEWSAAHTADSGGGVGALSKAVATPGNCGTWYNKSALFLEDLNGDGRDDIIYVGNFGGTFGWYAKLSNENGIDDSSILQSINGGYGWGGPSWGDTALMGDFNGDGRADAGVFRDGWWGYLYSTAAGFAQTVTGYGSVSFGQAGDIPLVGDFNGDGYDDFMVVRNDGNGNASWILAHNDQSGGRVNTFEYAALGLMTDKFFIADIDGDGRDDIGIYRDGYWAFTLTTDSGIGTGDFVQQVFGQTGDSPLVGKFDVLTPDFNDSGCVDFLDFAAMAGVWQVTAPDLPEDLDFSGTVDINDLALLVNRWLICLN